MGFIAGHAVAAALCFSVAAPPDPPQAPPSPTTRQSSPGDATETTPAAKAGGGLMLGGGLTMAVGAGVLIPIAMRMLLKTPPPNPDDYSAVAPFEHDVAIYRDTIDRATDIGVTGAVMGAVGAAGFVSGAIVWGVARARHRRGLSSRGSRRVRYGFGGGPTGVSMSASLRF